MDRFIICVCAVSVACAAPLTVNSINNVNPNEQTIIAIEPHSETSAKIILNSDADSKFDTYESENTGAITKSESILVSEGVISSNVDRQRRNSNDDQEKKKRVRRSVMINGHCPHGSIRVHGVCMTCKQLFMC